MIKNILLGCLFITTCSVFAQDLKRCQNKETKLYGYCIGNNFVIEAKYNDVLCFPDDTPDSIAAVKVGRLWGFINKEGNYVLEPQFDEAYIVMNGFARIKKDGKWGFVNDKGIVVVEPQYEDANNFGPDRKATVKKFGELSYGYLYYNKERGEISYRSPKIN